MSNSSKIESSLYLTDSLTEENLKHKKFIEKNGDKMWIHTFIHCYLDKENNERFMFLHMYFPIPLPETGKVKYFFQKDLIFKEVSEMEESPDYVFYLNQFDPETMKKVLLKKIPDLTEEMSDEELEFNAVKK